jgi:hypothetical protein
MKLKEGYIGEKDRKYYAEQSDVFWVGINEEETFVIRGEKKKKKKTYSGQTCFLAKQSVAR